MAGSCYILGRFENGKWTAGDTSFFTGFLDHITAPETAAPLDFFTWHGYLGTGNIDKLVTESEFVDKTLARYGLGHVIRIDAEWNCMICDDPQKEDYRTETYINLRNEKSASHVAGALYLMQRCPIDMAMYYDAQLWCEYGGLFHVPSLRPSKAYYAFRQFDRLRALGGWCPSDQAAGIYTLAATGAYDMFCAANITDRRREIRISFKNCRGKRARLFITDADRDDECIGELPPEGGPVALTPYSFIGIRID